MKQLAITLDRFGHQVNGAYLQRSLFLKRINKNTMINYTNHDNFRRFFKRPNTHEVV